MLGAKEGLGGIQGDIKREQRRERERKPQFVACSCGLDLTAPGVNQSARSSHLWADGRITGQSNCQPGAGEEESAVELDDGDGAGGQSPKPKG